MEAFAMFGLAAFLISISLMGVPAKVKKLELEVKKQKMKEKGETTMSKMLEELKGKECKITFENGIQSHTYKVIDLDDEWLKITSIDKKGNEKTEIVRIENVNEVEVL